MAQQHGNVPVRRRGGSTTPAWWDRPGLWPELSEMDRFLSAFRGGFPSFFGRPGPEADLPLADLMPAVDVIDKDKEIIVRAELPGIEEKDIDVQVTDHNVRMRGEKREQREEGEGDYYRSELSYGSFQRNVPLPPGIDREGVSANLRNGTLSVRLPKTQESQSQTKKVEITS